LLISRLEEERGHHDAELVYSAGTQHY